MYARCPAGLNVGRHFRACMMTDISNLEVAFSRCSACFGVATTVVASARRYLMSCIAKYMVLVVQLRHGLHLGTGSLEIGRVRQRVVIPEFVTSSGYLFPIQPHDRRQIVADSSD